MLTDVSFVFGYGSLARDALARPRAFPARLKGFARVWGVAMDNSRDLPAYKWYADPAGDRPRIHVCFLDLTPAPGRAVDGVCLPVDAEQLPRLDARERNYVRVDVSAAIGHDATVWTYVGSPAGRARFAAASAAGTAVVDAGYLTTVRAGLRALGPSTWPACAASLATGSLPVLDLVRHDLP